MKNSDSWDFNVWECKEEELPLLAMEMLSPFIPIVPLDKKVLEGFILEVKKHYYSRPYHNFRHVMDVTQFIHKLDKEGVLQEKLNPLERFALHLAGLCHDIGHPGRNNDFQKSFATDLYKDFGESSTLERYHLSIAEKILSQVNLLSHLSPDKKQAVLNHLSELILATDMAVHEAILKKIKKEGTSPSLIGILVIKSADLGQLIRPKPVSDIWVKALYNELQLQRKDERERGKNDHLSDAEFYAKQLAYQPVFIKTLALPLFEALVKVFPKIHSLKDRVEMHLQECKKLT